MELCFGLLVLFLVLLLLAAIGHGLWLAAAGLLRLLAGRPSPHEARRRREGCPLCGEPVRADDFECVGCGLRLRGAAAAELRDLDVTVRQLRRFHEAGAIDEATFDLLEEQCQEARAALTRPRPQPQTARRPVLEDIPEVLPVPAAPPRPTPESAPVRATPPPSEPPPLPPPPPPAPPRRTLGQLLGGFMEEKNILWGELVGGLLIVGCSLALVVSLWGTLQQVPYFPFAVFLGIAAALVGAGHYTLHHWKLDATSRGLLAIGLLLVPLNGLVLAGLTRGAGPLDLGIQAVGLVALAGLAFVGGRVLTPSRPPLLTVAVAGAVAVMLLVPPFVDGAAAGVVVLAGVAAACQAGAGAVALAGGRRRQPFEEKDGRELLAFLGLTTFAAAAALGFVAYRSGDVRHALALAAPAVAVSGAPLLAGGLFLFRGRADRLPPWLTTTASGVALGGTLVLVVALALAWPIPTTLVAVAAVNGVVLTAAALYGRLPVVHGLALGCAALGLLTGYHLLAGHLDADKSLPVALTSPESGVVLIPLALLIALGAEGLTRRGRRGDALAYLLSGGALAGLSLTLLAARTPFAPGPLALAAGLYGVTAILLHQRWGRGDLFVVGQGLLAAAALFVVAWGLGLPGVPFAPRHLPYFGLALTALAFIWIFLRPRLAAGPSPDFAEVAFAFVVVGQWFAVVFGAGPAVLAELAPGHGGTGPDFGGAAWLLLPATMAVLFLSLRRRPDDAPLGLAFAVVAVPFLAAGFFASDVAAATALRWGLAGGFVLATLAFAKPNGLAHLVPLSDSSKGTMWPGARQFLLVTTVGPVLLLTVWAAAVGFAGGKLGGPADGSFFARIGRLPSDLIPLALVVLGLVGRGWHERVAGFTFAAGLLATATVAGGYALHVTQTTGTLAADEALRVALLGSLTASAWAVGWLLARPAWQDGAAARARDYVSTQIAIGIVAAAVVLIGGGLILVVGGPSVWTTTAGSLLGAASLALAVAAVGVARRRGVLPIFFVDLLGGASLAAVALVACAVERVTPGGGQRTLFLGYALLSVAWALLPQAERWAGVAAGLAVLLGAEAALGDRDLVAAAAASALAGVAGAVCAIRRRRDDWAFLAGLCVHFAASLVVWQVHLVLPFADWGVTLLQTNAAAGAAVALGWLAWLGRRGEPSSTPVFLRVQLGLAIVACVLLPLLPFLALVFEPGRSLSAALAQAGDAGGWLALLLTAAAAFWLFGRRESSQRLLVAAPAALAGGVLLACFVNRWDTGDWLSFHTLLGTWSAVPAGVAALAFVVASRRDEVPLAVRAWVHAAGLTVVALAIRASFSDPLHPLPSCLATLSVAAAAALLATVVRRPAEVTVSALLVNLAAVFAWHAWDRGTASRFLAVQALGLGASAAFWTVLDFALRRPPMSAPLREVVRLFRTFAVVVGLILLAVVAALDLATGDTAALTAWGALAALMATLLAAHSDGDRRLTSVGLYVSGLTAVGLALPHLGAAPASAAYAAGLLAAHAVGAALVARSFKNGVSLWFEPAQAVVALVAVGLSAWATAATDDIAARVAAPGAVAGLTVAALLMVRRGDTPEGESPLSPRFGVLLLGGLFLTVLGWAVLGVGGVAAWLHRDVVVLTVLATMTLLYGVVLARLSHRLPRWADAGRRSGPVFGVLALVVLFVVLGQEFLLFNPDPAVKRTPMLPWAVVVVGVALVGMTVAQVRFAVVPGRDPFDLPERRRTVYVYLAEILALGLFLHVRLNVPWLFGERLVRFWTFLVMGMAFVFVGAGEFFARRRRPVLAGPLYRTGLLLPLVPLIAFWVRPPEPLQDWLGDRLPGTQPLLAALNKLPTYHSVPSQFDKYALLWVLLGGLFAGIAAARRSPRHALAAALAANVGLWCLLHHSEWWFGLHPQVWLVPLAVILLVAEHVNRETLGAARSAGLRYAALGLLYLSSTADMFLAGLGNSLVLPLVLAGLSVGGVFAGILLRVRAFLFLGVGFLGLVIFSMVWHAAVDLRQTWLWWASGVVLGVVILAVFALFEKRRNDILRVVDRVKAWE